MNDNPHAWVELADEIKTTFASTYTKEISLAEALRLDEIAVYSRMATARST